MKSDGNLEHIAFIMDGNLRYSNMQGIEKRDGYTAGIDVANELMTYCAEKGIRHITFFAFSTENWFRNSQDVNMLISVFEEYLEIQKEQIKNGKNSRFRIYFVAIEAPSVRRRNS